MKNSIHPNYNHKITIICNSCKTEYRVGSTSDNLQVEVCANCHPFYTGKSGQLVDTENRVKTFMQRLESADQQQLVLKKKKNQARKGKPTETVPQQKLTLKDMLKQMQ